MNDKLILLPIQIIDQEDGVILKRGLDQILIPDSNALLIVRVIQNAMLQGPKSTEELLGLFTGPVRPLIAAFLEHLRKKRFLLPEHDGSAVSASVSEGAQDVFYWHFNKFQAQIAATLNQTRWIFAGINKLNQMLIEAMLVDGMDNYSVVDDPMLRNIENFDDHHQLVSAFWQSQQSRIITEDCFFEDPPQDMGFVVAASEFGSSYLLERWNEFAVNNDLGFYPVLLQNMVGYAGPLVIPKESACFACLKARQNSNSTFFKEKRMLEKFAFAGQTVVAYHQSMLKVLASVAQFDLVKFKSNIQWEVGVLCEINLLDGSMSRRKLLKAPRCPVCSGLHDIPLVNIHKQMTSKEAWDEIRQTVGNYEN